MLLLLFLLVYVLASYTIAIPAEIFDEQEPAQEFCGGGQSPVFGTNKFSSREEEKADQSVVFQDFSSDYFCESEKLIF